MRSSDHAVRQTDAPLPDHPGQTYDFAPPDESEPRSPSRSLFGEILDWMLAPLLLLWPLSLAVTYLIAQSIANGPFDHTLQTNAYVLAQQVHRDGARASLALPPAALDFLRADSAGQIYYQGLGAHGELLGGTPDLPLPPEDAHSPTGVVHLRDGTLKGNDIRIAYLYVQLPPATPGAATEPGTSALVQVGETLERRNRLANAIIKGVILPQFIVLPLAIVLVWFGLTRGLAPLHALREHIRARRPDDLSPLQAERAPPEIAPLVGSLNELLGRLEQSMQMQQRFIADAAHQLKTPLAGLRTQAELALRQLSPDELRRSLSQIAASSEQAARLANQLLALARTENSARDPAAFSAIPLDALTRNAVQDWFQAARARQIDLGYEAPAQPLTLTGHALMLREMLNNLIDNAIRYTPVGGSVTVRLRPAADGEAALIEVEDTGPGIPIAEREHVFERFYRILGSGSDGSGLGLAIVREIVQIHRGDIVIAEPHSPHPGTTNGTLIRVSLPLAPASTTAPPAIPS